MAFGKLGSLITTNAQPVGIFTAASSQAVTVYVNNNTNENNRYSIGVSTNANDILNSEYVRRNNYISPLEVVEVEKLYIDVNETLVVQSQKAGVSFSVIGTGGGGDGRVDSIITTDANKGKTLTLTSAAADTSYTLGINNQGYEDTKIWVGVADENGDLNSGWIIFAQPLTAGANFTITDLVLAVNQSIVVKASSKDISFTPLAGAPSAGGGGGGGGASGLWQSTDVGINTVSNVGIATTNPQTTLQIGSVHGVTSGKGSWTAVVGVPHNIDTFDTTQYDFKFAEYTLHFQETTNTQAQKALIIKHTSGVSIQEYAIMTDNNTIVSMGATVEDGTVKLQATPESGISGITTYRFVRNTML